MNDISTGKVIEWLRARAAELNATADTLESNLAVEVTAETIKRKLGKISSRPKELAHALRTTEGEIEAIVSNPENGFVIGERGWISVATEPAKNN